MHTVTTRSAKSTSWLESEIASRIIYVNCWISFGVAKAVGNLLWQRGRHIDLTSAGMLPGKRYVIAANHQSVLDPFMICGQVPVSVWRRFGSFRFFTANGLFKNPLLLPGMLALGCFPAKAHIKYPYGLTYAKEQLLKGRSVMIFPEGRRTIRGESPVRHGIEALAELEDVLIIPAHIEWRKRGWRRSFQVGLGQPFSAQSMTADEIMNRVYDVPVSSR